MKKDPPPFILAQPEEKNILDCECPCWSFDRRSVGRSMVDGKSNLQLIDPYDTSSRALHPRKLIRFVVLQLEQSNHLPTFPVSNLHSAVHPNLLTTAENTMVFSCSHPTIRKHLQYLPHQHLTDPIPIHSLFHILATSNGPLLPRN